MPCLRTSEPYSADREAARGPHLLHFRTKRAYKEHHHSRKPGFLYTELGETEKALNDYNTLLIENPEHQEALYCRGLLYIQLQNYMWAEQDFDKILEVNEKSVRARLGHAILEKMRGNYDERTDIQLPD